MIQMLVPTPFSCRIFACFGLELKGAAAQGSFRKPGGISQTSTIKRLYSPSPIAFPVYCRSLKRDEELKISINTGFLISYTDTTGTPAPHPSPPIVGAPRKP